MLRSCRPPIGQSAMKLSETRLRLTGPGKRPAAEDSTAGQPILKALLARQANKRLRFSSNLSLIPPGQLTKCAVEKLGKSQRGKMRGFAGYGHRLPAPRQGLIRVAQGE